MEKIYGYKQSDVLELIQFLKEKEGEALTSIFDEFAELHKKSKGTIRNMYYALVKKSGEDKAFAEKYLNGKPLIAQKIEMFDDDEERSLVKSVLLGQKTGVSARKVIMRLAKGDDKQALRYQNKYRNVIKRNPSLVSSLVAEIREENGSCYNPFEVKEMKASVPDYQLRRLQSEINGLLDRVSSSLKQENAYLKNRLSEIEIENIKLKNLLYGGELSGKSASFFKKKRNNDMLN